MGVFNVSSFHEGKVFLDGFKQMANDLKTGNVKRQIPNILTLSRLLTPSVLLIQMWNIPIAITVFSLLAFTDAIDGFFARKFKCQSEFGQLLDPFCDKFLYITLMAPLLILNPLFVGITVLLEVLTAGITAFSLRKNNHPKTTKKGKTKANVLVSSIILTYILSICPISPILFQLLSSTFLTIAAGFQLSAIYEYGKIDKEKSQEKESLGLEKYDSYPEKKGKVEKKVFGYEIVINPILKTGKKVMQTINPNYKSRKEQLDTLRQEKELLQSSTEEIQKKYTIKKD